MKPKSPTREASGAQGSRLKAQGPLPAAAAVHAPDPIDDRFSYCEPSASRARATVNVFDRTAKQGERVDCPECLNKLFRVGAQYMNYLWSKGIDARGLVA